MAAQPSGLDADQVRVVQQALSALLAAGLEDMTVGEVARRFNVDRNVAGTWRNIRYGVEGNRRLPIMSRPSHGSREVGGLPFGTRFSVLEVHRAGCEVWLKVEESKWVLAKAKDVVTCIDTQLWKDHEGPITKEAFAGQVYPHSGMFTEGFAGASDICLVSASGDGFWREINVEMLYRDMATSTVFEAQWGGGAKFTTWVAYYAANVVLFAEVRALKPKAFVVTVKPTARWIRYVQGACAGAARSSACLGARAMGPASGAAAWPSRRRLRSARLPASPGSARAART